MRTWTFWKSIRIRFFDPHFYDLDINNCLANERAIEDIDKSLFELNLIYKYCVDSNDTNDNISMKWRKTKHYCIILCTVLTLARYLFYLFWSFGFGRVPGYLFDFTRYFEGLDKYIQLLQLLVSIMAFRICYVLGTDIKHMKWLFIIRVLKGISPVNQLLITNQKKKVKTLLWNHIQNSIFNCFLYICNQIFIFIVRYFSPFIRLWFWKSSQIWFDFIITIFSFVYLCVPIVQNGVKYFLIIQIYCIFLVNSHNKQTKELTRGFQLSNQMIKRILIK